MKAISVRQPWAHAIIHLGKDVENRTRNIAGTFRGPLAIQVSATYFDQHSIGETERITGAPVDLGPLYLGYIIGIVDLVDVHKWPCGNTSIDEACSKWAEAGQVIPVRGRAPIGMTHLVLANPRPLAYPMWIRGRLGLWDVDDAKILPRLEVA